MHFIVYFIHGPPVFSILGNGDYGTRLEHNGPIALADCEARPTPPPGLCGVRSERHRFNAWWLYYTGAKRGYERLEDTQQEDKRPPPKLVLFVLFVISQAACLTRGSRLDAYDWGFDKHKPPRGIWCGCWGATFTAADSFAHGGLDFGWANGGTGKLPVCR